jgi:hypothetical protein
LIVVLAECTEVSVESENRFVVGLPDNDVPADRVGQRRYRLADRVLDLASIDV